MFSNSVVRGKFPNPAQRSGESSRSDSLQFTLHAIFNYFDTICARKDNKPVF